MGQNISDPSNSNNPDKELFDESEAAMLHLQDPEFQELYN